MAIDISATTRRIVYTGSSGVGPYAFAFEVLAQTDIAVYFNTTELTLTTDYTVALNPDGTGSVTIVVGTNVPTTPTASDRITIVGDRTIQRTTDFTTGGPLFATSLNDEFDSQTIFTQQVLEQSDRSLRAPNTDPTTINMTLPLNTIRANKTLAFDADGNPTTGEIVGNWRGDWAASTDYNKRDLIKDTTNNNVYICTVAHTSSGAEPISTNTDAAKWDLMVDAADAAAAQAAAEAAQAAAEAAQAAAELAETNAETAETNAETAETNAEAAQAAAELAQTGAETAETNAETAQSAAEAAQAAAEAVFDNFDDAYLGAKASDPTVDNDGDPLADGALYFDTTNDIMKVYDLATTTWFQLTPTVLAQTNINTVAAIEADVSAVAAIDSDVTTVAGIDSNVTTVAGVSGNVTTVAGVAANVTTVAGISSNVTTVAGISADVTTVAGIDSDVTTVATNVADVVTFATTYLGAFSSAPSTSVTGALYYNTTDSQLYVWNGSAWDAAAFSVSGTVTSFNTRTGAITLSSADVTGALTYTPYDAANVSAFGGTLIDDADAATARTTLGLGTAATTAASDYATAAQGTLADSAVQPADNVSTLTNDSGFITGNETVTLSGDVTGSGTTAITTTLGTVAVNKGGTGQTTYTDGELLIGNTTGNTLTKATLTAGSGISVTNGSGAITIASTGGGGFTNMETFTSSGTWTNPGTVTRVKVTVIGGGGGGGISPYPGPINGLVYVSGGAGGGTAIETLTIPTAPVSITIGDGGAGMAFPKPTAANFAASGGTSSFGAFCSATGGAGGLGSQSTNFSPAASFHYKAAGGVGIGATININGEPTVCDSSNRASSGTAILGGRVSWFLLPTSIPSLPQAPVVWADAVVYGAGGGATSADFLSPVLRAGNGMSGVVIVEY